MNYIEIGRRIREERCKRKMTQALLAEKSELSVVHISHIESGTTKLSLPALVSIANALNITADTLLCDVLYESKAMFTDHLGEVLSDCDAAELGVMVDMLIALKKSMRSRNMAHVRD